ncbi:MAG: FGGY family carbohydrate kinase [Candidatus Hodarchaeales archaeon]|jgi:sugar (pentulose or hexulose) kinase
MNTPEIKFTIGIDVGSSGIRILLINGNSGVIVFKKMLTYIKLEQKGYIIWSVEKKLNVDLLFEIILNQLELLQKKFPNIFVKTISISSIGPSIVFLDNSGKPIGLALTYAYQGAEEYIKYLENDFQEQTGGLYSAALPYVQLLEVKAKKQYSRFVKLTTINDYISWRMTNLPVEQVFSSVPNASYTGFYSIKTKDWDETQLEKLGLSRKFMPRIVPLGSIYKVNSQISKKCPIFKEAQVVTGTIDGLDAFWAVGVKQDDKILVGSAGTTGAWRLWRVGPTTKYNSRLVLCCHVSGDDWVEIIPFNNVGTSLKWLVKQFRENYYEYLDDDNELNLDLLEELTIKRLKGNEKEIKSYISNLPIYFPYIEGELRGPNGRGKRIKGGYVDRRKEHDGVELYLSLIIGIVNLFRHNLDMLNPSDEYNEVRLTGMVARNCPSFCHLLSTAIKKNVTIMKIEHSIAWATGMRTLEIVQEMIYPEVEILKPSFIPINNKYSQALNEVYKKYLEIYEKPDEYKIL